MSNLKLPPGITPVGLGTTGMSDDALSYPRNDVLKHLKSVKYDVADAEGESWDCEDMAFFGIASARCKFPGIRIGCLINTQHALITFWYKDGNQLIQAYYDPTSDEEPSQFQSDVLVGFPPAGLSGHKEIPPYDNARSYPYLYGNKAALFLDRNYKESEPQVNEVKQYLSSKSYDKCITPGSTIDEQETSRQYYLIQDKAFWVFSQARKKFKGYPIGVAFGTAKIGADPLMDYATLVLWESHKTVPKYWDVDAGDLSSMAGVKFTPNIIIV
jgi:hypothetical protein